MSKIEFADFKRCQLDFSKGCIIIEYTHDNIYEKITNETELKIYKKTIDSPFTKCEHLKAHHYFYHDALQIYHNLKKILEDLNEPIKMERYKTEKELLLKYIEEIK